MKIASSLPIFEMQSFPFPFLRIEFSLIFHLVILHTSYEDWHIFAFCCWKTYRQQMTKFTNFDLVGASKEITDTFIWNNSHKEPYILARIPGEFRCYWQFHWLRQQELIDMCWTICAVKLSNTSILWVFLQYWSAESLLLHVNALKQEGVIN